MSQSPQQQPQPSHAVPSYGTAVLEGVETVQPSAMPLMQTSHAVEHPLQDAGFYGSAMNCFGSIAGFFGAIPCCMCCPNPYQRVNQGSVGLVARFGRFYKAVDPGLVRINPFSERLTRIDVKIQIDAIGKVSIMTKDNVNITIDCVVYWHIEDVFRAEYGVSNVRFALMERTQTTLRAILGSQTLQECIENRESIAQAVQTTIAEPARAWGIKVETMLIKDLSFSADLQASLSSAATQKRIGESKVIAAQAEVDSAKLMREAADILNTPAAMQIRYLETMQGMAKTAGSKVIFLPGPGESTPAGTNTILPQMAANMNN
ncbi:MAG: hypothetical protein DHS80DRAFT_33962 [Piptocephalis tieghemiana]|nr:MAG: hypothetical protein DHS80DRAFT_33962 [Piptocephalis tieghemiana]